MTTCPPHHYILDEPNGPDVAGRCRKCGDERSWKAVPVELFEYGKLSEDRDLGLPFRTLRHPPAE